MLPRIKLFIGAFFIMTLGFFLHPIPAQAADNLCLRMTLAFDGTNYVTPFYDYTLSTKALTSFTPGNTISWYDESPDGRWVAVQMSGDEKGVEFIRFFDRVTERSIDYPIDFAYSPYAYSGWSPDGQFYALRAINYVDGAEEHWALIFGRDRSLLTQYPYNDQGGHSVLSWLSDSRRFVMIQPDPSETSNDKKNYTFEVASISGGTAVTALPAPLYSASSLFPSPDGHFMVLGDLEAMMVVDTQTGTVVTASQNLSVLETRLDIAWSPDSQYFLYEELPTEPTEEYRANVMRYSVATQESEMVAEYVGIPYTAGSYTAIGIPAPKEGAMLISQKSEETIKFSLIEAQTGTLQEVGEEPLTDGSQSAMSEWSPLGDVVWVSLNTTTFFRPETQTTVSLPEGSTIVAMYNNLLVNWSANGEWISSLVQNSDATQDLILINTRTGTQRVIPIEGDTGVFYASPSNTGDVLMIQNGSLYLVLEDDTLTLLTDSLQWYGGGNTPLWSPDGTKIAVIDSPATGSSVLKIFQSNGKLISSTDLPMAFDTIESFDWQPCV